MTGSIRTEIQVGTPGQCPIAQASADAGTRVNQITRSASSNEAGMLTEEFALDADASYERSDAEKLLEFDGRSIYRFERTPGHGCVCDRIEQYGCPVSDLHARDGALVVSFYVPDVETVQEIVSDLHGSFDQIQVRQLTRTAEETDSDFVFIDRERLTDRQREVLETSYEMGYFEHPKRANAGDVAEALDIAPSTFSEHLAAAQRKLLETIVGS